MQLLSLLTILCVSLEDISVDTFLHSSCTAALNSLEVLQPLASNRPCTQDHKFTIGLRSWLLEGQDGRRLMLASCCLFHLLMQAGAGLCALSLSCCNTQEEVPCCQKSLSPSGRSADINTALYSACVMFDAVVPFFVLCFDTWPLMPATSCSLVTPNLAKLPYTLTPAAWLSSNASQCDTFSTHLTGWTCHHHSRKRTAFCQ